MALEVVVGGGGGIVVFVEGVSVVAEGTREVRAVSNNTWNSEGLRKQTGPRLLRGCTVQSLSGSSPNKDEKALAVSASC